MLSGPCDSILAQYGEKIIKLQCPAAAVAFENHCRRSNPEAINDAEFESFQKSVYIRTGRAGHWQLLGRGQQGGKLFIEADAISNGALIILNAVDRSVEIVSSAAFRMKTIWPVINGRTVLNCEVLSAGYCGLFLSFLSKRSACTCSGALGNCECTEIVTYTLKCSVATSGQQLLQFPFFLRGVFTNFSWVEVDIENSVNFRLNSRSIATINNEGLLSISSGNGRVLKLYLAHRQGNPLEIIKRSVVRLGNFGFAFASPLPGFVPMVAMYHHR